MHEPSSELYAADLSPPNLRDLTPPSRFLFVQVVGEPNTGSRRHSPDAHLRRQKGRDVSLGVTELRSRFDIVDEVPKLGRIASSQIRSKFSATSRE